MLDLVLQAVLLGGLYTLFALGQSLMFGVMRLTNTAQATILFLRKYFLFPLRHHIERAGERRLTKLEQWY